MYKLRLLALSLLIFLLGCDLLPHKDAEFRVTGWYQPYYRYLREWSDTVEVHYTVENTGSVDIDYYEVWFQANFRGIVTSRDWTNGLDVKVGEKRTEVTYMRAKGISVRSVEVVDYELKTY